jgi:hypothetical protein
MKSSTCTCPKCGRVFRVPEDEWGDHPCPRCGWEPSLEHGFAEDDGGNTDYEVEKPTDIPV